MKPSHFTAPRSLAECQFALNADPIEKLEDHASWGGRLLTAAGAVFAVAVAVVVAVGAA